MRATKAGQGRQLWPGEKTAAACGQGATRRKHTDGVAALGAGVARAAVLAGEGGDGAEEAVGAGAHLERPRAALQLTLLGHDAVAAVYDLQFQIEWKARCQFCA